MKSSLPYVGFSAGLANELKRLHWAPSSKPLSSFVALMRPPASCAQLAMTTVLALTFQPLANSLAIAGHKVWWRGDDLGPRSREMHTGPGLAD